MKGNGTPGPVFGLTRMVLSASSFVNLTDEEFFAARDAKRLLVEALGIEESLNRVLGNYLEYENSLLRGTLEGMIYSPGSWSEFHEKIHEVNRHVVNLLSGCRGYIDQSRHVASKCFGKDSEEVIKLQSWFASEYDSTLGYRSMEALRNFAQHRGLGVHHLAQTGWRDDSGSISVVRESLVPSIQPNRLSEEGGFKQSVLAELRTVGEVIDIRPLMREYVAGIARVHKKLREELGSRIEHADRMVQALIERYRQVDEESVVGLAAVHRDSSGSLLEEVQLFEDLIKRRESLVRRNRTVPPLEKVFVTNESPPANVKASS